MLEKPMLSETEMIAFCKRNGGYFVTQKTMSFVIAAINATLSLTDHLSVNRIVLTIREYLRNLSNQLQTTIDKHTDVNQPIEVTQTTDESPILLSAGAMRDMDNSKALPSGVTLELNRDTFQLCQQTTEQTIEDKVNAKLQSVANALMTMGPKKQSHDAPRIETTGRYWKVANNEFNQTNNPTIIGKVFADGKQPSYTSLVEVPAYRYMGE